MEIFYNKNNVVDLPNGTDTVRLEQHSEKRIARANFSL